MMKTVMNQLIKYGEVQRGVLGVNIQTLTPDIAESMGLANVQGALVSQVVEGSAGREGRHQGRRRRHRRSTASR